MERVVRRSVTGDSASIELLDGVTDAPREPERGRRPVWATAAIVGAVGVLYVVFLWLPNAGGPPPGDLHGVETRFGDPFELDWVALESSGDDASPYARPQPMASLDPPCVGFGRLDWPEAERHPSVAHCLRPGDARRLAGDGVALVRDVVAGSDTWYLFLFGGDLDELEVAIDEGDALGSDRIYRTGPYAAILVPNGHELLALTWSVAGGNRYRCSVTTRAGGVDEHGLDNVDLASTQTC